MIKVTISRMKNVNWQLEKIDDEIFEYHEDEDINVFAKIVIDALFKISEDSDEINIKYRSHVKAHSRDGIKSNSIRHIAGSGIMESRILEDLNLFLKKEDIESEVLSVLSRDKLMTINQIAIETKKKESDVQKAIDTLVDKGIVDISTDYVESDVKRYFLKRLAP